MAHDKNKTGTHGAEALMSKLKGGMQFTLMPTPLRLVSISEQISLTALINFVADQKGLVEGAVLRNFTDRFNIASLQTLPAVQYDQAVRYLVDQVPDSAVA